MLSVLVVDDELPALEELGWLLRQDPRVGSVRLAQDGATALRLLDEQQVDALFLDIRMPGLDGLALARVLARFKEAPQVVFVTAYDDHAVDAFELDAADYLLKPVHPERLAEAVRRVVVATEPGGDGPDPGGPADPLPEETIPVELGGVTRFVARSDVRWVEAAGDYARLHTADGSSHLVRVPLTTLEERWGAAGFVRIHRSTLVALTHIDELRLDTGHCTVRVGDEVLQVSRRHTRELRDLLVRRARPVSSEPR
ncbi:MAG TPA: LytTR family DNA-binding domain-containing protein [Actinomycetes bacterium]|nr:LytTR family DNA-binding domain-containing protein [Actinomycetes bacterium]